MDQLREQLKASTLCHPDRVVTYRTRPFDPWFDDEYREAKRLTCRLVVLTVPPVGGLPVKSIQVSLLTLTLPRLRGMLSVATTVNFVIVKAMYFGVTHAVESERASPRRLWRSVNLLLGRGKAVISASMNSASFSR